MTRWVEVQITQDHIDKAKRKDPYACLVALALKDATGYLWQVEPDRALITLPQGSRPAWTFPRPVRFILRKTEMLGQAMPPCSFRLPARFASDRWRGMGADVEAV